MLENDEAIQEEVQESAADAGGDPAAELIRERDELRDKLLRAQAECANVAKRLRQDHAQSMRHASLGLAKSMLPVLDGLERSIKSLDEAGRDDPIAAGIKLLREEFLKALREHGVEPIESVGRPFDPGLHEALMQDPKSDLPAGTVATEFEKGYRMNDRVLRHSKVVVSSRPEEADSDGSPVGSAADGAKN